MGVAGSWGNLWGREQSRGCDGLLLLPLCLFVCLCVYGSLYASVQISVRLSGCLSV